MLVSLSARLPRSSSIMTMVGAVNLVYSLYSYMMRDFVTAVILIVTYFGVMYLVAFMDAEAKKLRRAREKPSAPIKGMRLK